MNGLQLTGTIARRALLVAALGATFAASAMLTIYLSFQVGEVKVPNIVGLSQEDARRAIEASGLNYKIRRQHFDQETPAGAVTEQDPVAGFPVKSGFDIKIDLSKGPDPSGAPPVEEILPPGPPPANQNGNQEKKKKKPDNANGNVNSNASANSNSAKKPAENIDPKTGKPIDPKANDNKPKPGDTPKPANKPGDTSKEKDPEKPKKPSPPKIPPHD